MSIISGLEPYLDYGITFFVCLTNFSDRCFYSPYESSDPQDSSFYPSYQIYTFWAQCMNWISTLDNSATDWNSRSVITLMLLPYMFYAWVSHFSSMIGFESLKWFWLFLVFSFTFSLVLSLFLFILSNISLNYFISKGNRLVCFLHVQFVLLNLIL